MIKFKDINDLKIEDSGEVVMEGITKIQGEEGVYRVKNGVAEFSVNGKTVRFGVYVDGSKKQKIAVTSSGNIKVYKKGTDGFVIVAF